MEPATIAERVPWATFTPFHLPRQERPAACDVAQTALNRLRASPYFVLRSVAVEFRQGVLALHGRVTSFFYKQMAQETVRNIEGVVRVLNEVSVIQEADGTSVGIAAGSVSRFSGGESHAGLESKMR